MSEYKWIYLTSIHKEVNMVKKYIRQGERKHMYQGLRHQVIYNPTLLGFFFKYIVIHVIRFFLVESMSILCIMFFS